ncbi:hypothetical protein BK147_11275 [Paenibacillus sp. FSL R7-0337]|nr:hypothetical protein BK147_11275 [Paenibacillus sp. FSL R7-0337]
MGKFTLTKEEFKAARADGKTIAQIAKEQDVAEATVYKHMTKWTEEPSETQLLREKEALPVDQQAGEIKRLKAEVEHWKAQATEVVTLAGKAAEETMAKIEQLQAARRGEAAKNDELRLELDQAVAVRETAELDLGLAETRCDQYVETIDQLATQCDGLQEELNRLITERDDLVAEVDDLRDDIRRLREIQAVSAAPPSDVNLLDRGIADLTRAKWILDRLNA